MRRTAILALVVLGMGLAAPASARHRHSHFWVGWSFGFAGWPWWYSNVAYGPPVPVGAARPDLAVVDTDVEPEEARVFLDGEMIGTADDFDGYPGYLYLEKGHYTLEFRLAGYRPEKLEIDAKPGGYFPIELKLERAPGEKPEPWWNRPEGPVNRVFGPKSGSEPRRAYPDPTLRKELQPQETTAPPRPGAGAALDLRVNPDNAAVYIDGSLVGTAAELGRLQRGVAVAPGKHVIEIMAPGRIGKRIEVDVAEGQRQQVVVELDEGAGQPSPKGL
jgi:hypothetical protein